MRAVSPTPSPFGLTTVGSTRSCVTATGGSELPSTPRPGRAAAARTPPAAIVYVYRPGTARLASQVQSTAVLVPVPEAAIRPSESVTVTVQEPAEDSRAVKRTLPPTPPRISGE